MTNRTYVTGEQQERLRRVLQAKKQVQVDASPSEDVSISLTITKKPRPTKRHVGSSSWDWRALRDFVEQEMASHGFERDDRPDVVIASICKGFIHRHGPQKAERIVRTAFSLFDGVYEGIPVTFQSLVANSDPHFAEPMLARFDGA